MSKKFHIALGVSNINESISDYSKRLSCDPCVIVPNEYALFRTETLNVSIRQSNTTGLRHLGWEDPSASTFSEENDTNNIPWERFSQSDQLDEILSLWPNAEIKGTPS